MMMAYTMANGLMRREMDSITSLVVSSKNISVIVPLQQKAAQNLVILAIVMQMTLFVRMTLEK